MTTWNPSDKAANVTLSNGNLTCVNSAVGLACVRSTTSKAPGSGRWFYQATLNAIGNQSDDCVGVALSTASLTSFNNGGNATGSTGGAAYYSRFASNNVSVNGIGQSGSLGLGAPGDVISIAADMISLLVWFKRNLGNWNGSGSADPAAGIGGFDISAVFTGANPAFAIAGFQGDAPSAQWTGNFGGASPYTIPIPGSFQSWDYISVAPQFPGYAESEW